MSVNVSVKSLESVYVGFALALFSGGLHSLYSLGPETDALDLASQLAKLPAYIYGILVLSRNLIAVRRLVLDNQVLTLMAFAAFLSILWSIDPLSTFRRACLLLLTMSFGLAIVIRFSLTQFVFVMAATFLFLSAITLGSMVGSSVAIHQDAHYPALRGFFSHKNVAGRVLALGVLCGLVLLSVGRHKKMAIACIMSCGLAVVLTLSMTTYVVVAAVTITYWLSKGLGRSRILLMYILSLAAVCLPFVVSLLMSGGFESVVTYFGRDPTLTGRTSIWETVYELTRENNLLLGYGYEAFWTAYSGALSTQWNMGPYIPPSAHNGLLQLFTSLGLVGVAMFVLSFISFFKRSLNQIANRGSIAPFIFLPYFLVINFSEPGILLYGSLIWVLYVAFHCFAGLKPIEKTIGQAPTNNNRTGTD